MSCDEKVRADRDNLENGNSGRSRKYEKLKVGLGKCFINI